MAHRSLKEAIQECAENDIWVYPPEGQRGRRAPIERNDLDMYLLGCTLDGELVITWIAGGNGALDFQHGVVGKDRYFQDSYHFMEELKKHMNKNLETVFLAPTAEDKQKLAHFFWSSPYGCVFHCKPKHCSVETLEDNAFEIFKTVFSVYSLHFQN